MQGPIKTQPSRDLKPATGKIILNLRQHAIVEIQNATLAGPLIRSRIGLRVLDAIVTPDFAPKSVPAYLQKERQ